MSEKLERVGEIEVLGRKVLVAKNGEFQLVEQAGVDVFGTPYFGTLVVPFPNGGSTAQSLIADLVQEIGRLLTERQGRNDSRRAALEES